MVSLGLFGAGQQKNLIEISCKKISLSGHKCTKTLLNDKKCSYRDIKEKKC
jgi:hypothetical protein